MIDIEITANKDETAGWDNRTLRMLTDKIEDLCRKEGLIFETKMTHGSSGRGYYQGYRIKVTEE